MSKADLDYIMDVLNGADGGVKFVKLKWFLDSLDPEPAKVTNLIRRFANLIRTVNDEEMVPNEHED